MHRLTLFIAALAVIAAGFQVPPAEGCTRAVYQGPEGRVLTGRSMDWKLPMVSNLWVFPRGMERDGAAGDRSVEWTSRYGSLAVSGYDIATADGMNEAGLVVNLLWEVEATYPADDGQTPRISLSVLPQYMLDRYATVAEAVADLGENPILVQGGEVPVGPPGRAATVHLSMSDATGDSAIIEFVDGEMTIWHDRSYQIMTNEPTYERQLAIREYWQGVNPREFLPGTVRATDRFVRASFYINAVEQTADPRRAAASVFSVIRQTSVPWGISIADQPNLSTTRWRIVADHKDLRYYVESVISPSVFWVDLTNLDFSEDAEVLKLDLGMDMERILAGESSASFEPAEPFTFQPADVPTLASEKQSAAPSAGAIERPTSPTPADSSRLSLDWAGTYSSVVPCASCPGIETTITLNDDETFQRSMRYIDESPIPVTDSGSFVWNDAGSIVTLNSEEGQVSHYQVGEHRLFLLDQQRQRIDSDLAAQYILHQHLNDPQIEDRRWVLTELRGQPVETGNNQKQAFLLLRSEESRLHGNAACNTFNGSYAIKSGQRIEFGENIAMTMMACPDMTVEDQFIDVLKMTDNYSISDEGSLSLNRARMAPLARFVQQNEQ